MILIHPDTVTTWINLSLVYQAKGDLITALENARCGLTIRRDKLPTDITKEESSIILSLMIKKT